MADIYDSRMEYTIVCITKCIICITIWSPLRVMIRHRYIRSFLTIRLHCGGKLRLCNLIWCTNIDEDFLLEELWWCMRDYFLCHCFQAESWRWADQFSSWREVVSLLLLRKIFFVLFATFWVGDLINVLREHVSKLWLVHCWDQASHFLLAYILFLFITSSHLKIFN